MAPLQYDPRIDDATPHLPKSPRHHLGDERLRHQAGEAHQAARRHPRAAAQRAMGGGGKAPFLPPFCAAPSGARRTAESLLESGLPASSSRVLCLGELAFEHCFPRRSGPQKRTTTSPGTGLFVTA